MNVIVLGAGAIGSLYAAKLAQRCDVTLVGRRAHVDAITRAGLRLIGHENGTHALRAVTEVREVLPQTLIVLTTKVNGSLEAIRAVAPLLRDDTVILCVQNGLHSERIVREAVGARPVVVLRAITQFGAIFHEPGVIDYKVAGYTLIERSPISGTIARLLTDCGLDGRVCENIKVEVWRKLIYNCVINPITSIIGSDVGSIADPRLDRLKRLVVDECLAVARADGVEFDVDFVRAISEVFGASRNIASMRQDLLNGKPTEIDFMNGAVADAGARFGIACPVNAALTAIVKAMERGQVGGQIRSASST